MAVEYVNKQDFLKALIDYKAACEASQDNIPIVPDYIGECLIKISEGMARRPNFSGYSWIDEMKGDAIETCLRYVKSFDPSKSSNPFGYFSTVCWYSFIGRISSEKKQSKIKRELIRYADFETFSTQEQDDEFGMNIQEFLSSIGEDEPTTKKVEKKEPGPLEGFM